MKKLTKRDLRFIKDMYYDDRSTFNETGRARIIDILFKYIFFKEETEKKKEELL